MLVMEEAKLAPPTPAVAPISRNTHSGVPGRWTKTRARTVGTRSTAEANTVQLRPPKRVTA
ncbi:hypothetical protein SMICM17S_04756 [Streptomyces microflavus]